ncbi:hypothetical protein ABT390_25980 [Streptomyces aurantiacus]|uniref:Uncharacterized protein n=1 Tax=Streptomyces aurantiacus JA 4570 TaxID=1286094 RepID=S3ZUC7_9ACTN|nr:hypothetical protein [Streptomyces aurantiacus]EPH46399.1 hypothetical protein STRAU_0535 [Streptomyces aurantiacus JA 4570]
MLYPSAVYGWAEWWLEREQNLAPTGQGPVMQDLPQPPSALDAVEAWRPYRLHMERAEQITWPAADPPIIKWPRDDDLTE